MSNSILNVSFYRFVKIDPAFIPGLRVEFRSDAEALGIKGTILLAPEGINGFLAGMPDSVREMVKIIEGKLKLDPLNPKESFCEKIPFKRMLVKQKKEIIAFGEGVVPAPIGPDDAKRITPEELDQWFLENKDFVVLDTRNVYEVRLGKFKNAIDPKIGKFTDFTKAFKELNIPKDKSVVTYCTGGIRCEKAAPWIKREGYENVYQLDGGILKYFEKTKGENWEGECFVFDYRVGLDAKLNPTGSKLCYACQEPLTTDDLAHESYEFEKSCPYCFNQKNGSSASRDRILA